MNLRDPFNDDQFLGKAEALMLRAYILFEVGLKLLTLGVEHARKFGEQVGIW